MTQHFDVIVIGGGINGTGIARDCAMRGLKTCLIEKKDFAAGASGANSGMVHGGPRYLINDVGTTKKSCLDSGYIQKIAPHLIFRIPFIFPVFGKHKTKGIMLEFMEAFFLGYDRFRNLKNGKPHTRLSKAEALKLEPGLHPDVLGAVTFDEWGIDAFRLCVVNAVSAAEAGAAIRNQTEVTRFIIQEEGDGTRRRVRGVEVKDLRTGETEELYAKIVFNAVGPWTNKLSELIGTDYKIRPTKGVHLTFERRIVNFAITAEAIDGRQIFIEPHEHTAILGTTDDDFYGDLDDLRVTEDEVEYLLQGIEHSFPSIRRHRILRAWAGIRPTLYGRSKYEDDLSREHEIIDHGKRDKIEGLLTMAGGKLAAYRLMAEEATDVVCKKLGIKRDCETHIWSLPGGEPSPSIEELSQKYGLPMLLMNRLLFRHGSRAQDILALGLEHPNGLSPVCKCELVTEAEIRYCIRNEWARNLDDLRRRTRLGMGTCQGAHCSIHASVILADELGLSGGQARDAALEFLEERWRGKVPILDDIQLQMEEFNQAINKLVARV